MLHWKVGYGETLDSETWVSLEILTRAVSVRGGNNIQTGEEGRGVSGGEVKTVNVDVAFKEFCFRTEKQGRS